MTKEEAIFEYCTRIGDNAVILGHRLSEWTGHSPILEEEMYRMKDNNIIHST